MEERDLPVIACSISNRFGAGYETASLKGVAHLIEHMVFTGTKTRTHEDISREIEKKGGVLNAFTANEVTSFWFKLPSEHLFAGLDILSDLLLHPLFTKDKFEKEKKVILEEIKMYHDDPGRFVYDMITENLYEKPFGTSIIGSAKTVSALKRDFVYRYFQDHYSPSNYIVTLVGKGDFKKISTYLETYFPLGKKDLGIFPITLKQARNVEKRAGIDQAHFIFANHAPLLTDRDYYALEVLNAYLADGMSSKLFLKIREEKGLAYTVKGSVSAEQHYSYYTIYVGTRKEALEEVEQLIVKGFKNISSMQEKELEETKEQLVGLRKISSEESARVMNELLFYELMDRAETYYRHEKLIRAVTLLQVKNLARKMTEGYSTAAIVPL